MVVKSKQGNCHDCICSLQLSHFLFILCTFHFWFDIECKITRMQILPCFNLVIKTMRHLPNYHFCHKNLVQSIHVLPSSGIHRQKFASTFWLQKEKKINIWQRTQLQVKPNYDICKWPQCTCPFLLTLSGAFNKIWSKWLPQWSTCQRIIWKTISISFTH